MKKELIIKSFVGGHDVVVYKDCEYNPQIRKYVGGTPMMTIPYSGKMLSAKTTQEYGVLNVSDEISLPVVVGQLFTDVDPIPDKEECDYCIVSNKYLSACKALGMDTSRLLTICDTVTDENGRVIGCVNFNIN